MLFRRPDPEGSDPDPPAEPDDDRFLVVFAPPAAPRPLVDRAEPLLVFFLPAAFLLDFFLLVAAAPVFRPPALPERFAPLPCRPCSADPIPESPDAGSLDDPSDSEEAMLVFLLIMLKSSTTPVFTRERCDMTRTDGECMNAQ